MDASLLQAAQRVMAWHLQHTMLPPQPADTPDEDERASPADPSPETDSGAALPHGRS